MEDIQMDTAKWVTVSQAVDMLGMSERSIRRHLAEGKIESKLEGNRRLVKIQIDPDIADAFVQPLVEYTQ